MTTVKREEYDRTAMSPAPVLSHAVPVPAAAVLLDGDLAIPPNPGGLVLFAHGSGSSRHSPRNQFVAGELHRAGLATLLMDLLTGDEARADARAGRLRFDVDLLAGRLGDAHDWLTGQPGDVAGLSVGYFGASTGAAAALVAAARRPGVVAAVVSRGGRPDLAGAALPAVRAPTLLIVGGADEQVLALNRAALAQMRCDRRLAVVPGATHLFEEPGTLERVAALACEWFGLNMPAAHDCAGRREQKPFQNRTDAGRQLAARLAAYRGRADVLVLGLPRGGVPMAWEVARALGLPLDVFLVRKLGVPGHEELAMGAIASRGVRVLNQPVIRHLAISPELLEWVTAAQRKEVERRARLYRDGRPEPDLAGRTALLVDDGLATGSTMRAAVAAARQCGAARVVVAVPVAPAATCEALAREADAVVCLASPEPFLAVGQWYEQFPQVADGEVRRLLQQAPAAPVRSHGL